MLDTNSVVDTPLSLCQIRERPLFLAKSSWLVVVESCLGRGTVNCPHLTCNLMDRIPKISHTGGLFDKGEIIAELDITPDL